MLRVFSAGMSARLGMSELGVRQLNLSMAEGVVRKQDKRLS